MSRYPANIITKNPATPTGPSTYGSAPGIWRLDDVAYWVKQGVWPNANIVPDTYFPYVSLLLSTTSLSNANNNLFVDSSGVFSPISRTGNTTQGSFSPYGSNWSGYFDGSGDWISAPDNAAFDFGSGDFTLEFWVNFNSVTGIVGVIGKRIDETVYAPFLMEMYSGQLRLYMSTTGSSWQVNGLSTATLSTGQWYHIAVSRSGTTVYMFVNGVSVGSTASLSGSVMTNTSPLFIGANSGSPVGAAPVNGYMSNIRIVKGTALYTSNFTPPTAPLTAISGTSLLTCQSNRFRDASTNNLTITANGNSSVTDFSPFAPTPPGISYNQSDITNWSGYFDGSGDYLDVPNNTAFDQNTAFTVEMWVYPTVTSTDDYLYSQNTNNFFQIATNPSGFVVIDKSSVGFQVTSSAALGVGVWTHIAMVSNGSTISLYINGTSQGSASVGTTATSATTIRIGAYQGTGTLAFNGYISNLRVVKGTAVYTSNFTPPTSPLTAISGTSLLTLQNAAFTDNSTNNFVITPNGNTTVTGNSPFNTVGYWSNYFDGSGDWLTIPNNAAFSYGTGDFTMEVWVYKTATSGDRAVVDSYTLGSGGGTFGFLINDTQIVGYQTNVASYTFTYTVPNNSWNHIAFVRTGGNLICYVNGTSIGSQANSTNFVSASTIDIGRNAGSGGSQWIGYLSNLRVVKGTAVYTSNFTVPTTPLTAITNTSLLTCQNGRFIDNSTNAFTITVNGNTSVQSFDPFYTATIASNGGSMYFDGSGDYLVVPYNPALNILSGDFTVETWVYPTANSGFRPFFGQWYQVAGGGGFIVGSNGANFNFNFGPFSTGAAMITASTTFVVNSWYHIAVVRSGNDFTMYVNGVSVGTATSSATLAPINVNITFGNYYNSGGGFPATGATDFAGYLSGTRITKSVVYAAAFTPPTAPPAPTPSTTLFVNGMNAGIYDATAINDMETVGNAQVSTVQSKFGGSSVYFDGSGDYLLTPSNPAYALSGTSFTIEAWVYVTSSSEPYQHVVKGVGSGGNNLMYIDYSGGSTGVLSSQSGGTVATRSGVTLNTWHHLAVVRNGTSVTCYVNGVGGTPQTIDPGSSGSVSLLVGYDGGTSPARYFNGYMDDLRITKGVARYTANFTPPTQAFPTY